MNIELTEAEVLLILNLLDDVINEWIATGEESTYNGLDCVDLNMKIFHSLSKPIIYKHEYRYPS